MVIITALDDDDMIFLGGGFGVLTYWTENLIGLSLGSASVLRLLRQAEDRKYIPQEVASIQHPILHCTGQSDRAELVLQS